MLLLDEQIQERQNFVHVSQIVLGIGIGNADSKGIRCLRKGCKQVLVGPVIAHAQNEIEFPLRQPVHSSGSFVHTTVPYFNHLVPLQDLDIDVRSEIHNVVRQFGSDLTRLTDHIAHLEDGVYINLGSTVLLPEVFLKVLSAVRNMGFDVQSFTTVNMDFIQQYRNRDAR